MNIRTRFIVSVFAIGALCSISAMASIVFLKGTPMGRWAPLILFLAAFVGVYWLMRHYRSRLPTPTLEQTQRAIKANRRMAWIYLGGLAFGLVTEGRDLLTLPHGVGFLIPLIPIGLATIHLKTAARLSRKAAEPADLAKPG